MTGWLRAVARWVRRFPERALHPRRRAAARRRLAALGSADGLLFMCHGNVCRSPFAEAVARRLAGSGARIASAGVHGPDRHAVDDAITAARSRGFDLTGHRSRLAATDEVQAARCVVVMEPAQRTALAATTGRPAADILVLGDFDPEPITHRAIADPYGHPLPAFDACYARIERCVAALVDAALAGAESPGPYPFAPPRAE